MATSNKWLAVNKRKIDATVHNLEALRMRNVDLAGVTTFQEIKFLILSLTTELEKTQTELDKLKEKMKGEKEE